MAKSYTQKEIDKMTTDERSAAWFDADEVSKTALHNANVRDLSGTHTYDSNTGVWTNYDPNVDYNKRATDLYNAGNTQDAWQSLFGTNDSREAKIAGTGNDYGTTSQQIWDALISQPATQDSIKKQANSIITRMQTPDNNIYAGSKWDNALEQLMQSAIDFNYDDWISSDQYRMLLDRHTRQGRQAMQDVLGQVSSRTGGLASSYAETVAQQQYNDYMSQLESVARDAYANDRQNLIDSASLVRGMSEQDYQRYLDKQSADKQDQSSALNSLFELLGYQTDADILAYNRGINEDSVTYERWLTTRNEAQNRIYDYLVNQGGSVGDLDAAVITESGYTTAELNAMEAKYRANQEEKRTQQQFENDLALQKADGKGGGGSGGGTGGGNGGTGSGETGAEALFRDANASGYPESYISNHYKEYGFTKSTGLTKDYKTWLDNQEEAGAGDEGGDLQITNRNGDSWVVVPGYSRVTYQELYNMVESGEVIETVDKDKGTVTYTKNRNYQQK